MEFVTERPGRGFDEGKLDWEQRGYHVEDELCSWCGWGYIVWKDDGFRKVCTNYGECEASVG